MSPAYGKSTTLFEDIRIDFGKVYPEDYPDDIDPVYGSEVLFTYNQKRGNGSDIWDFHTA